MNVLQIYGLVARTDIYWNSAVCNIDWYSVIMTVKPGFCNSIEPAVTFTILHAS